jgi:hypothetical protein
MTTAMMTETARYFALCDAIHAQIKSDVATVGMKWRAVVDVPAFVAWVASKLDGFGMTAAAKHCNRGDLAEYACWVAREILMATNPVYPELVTAAVLSGDAEIDYWRAVTIASEMLRREDSRP